MASEDGSRFTLYRPADLDNLPEPSWLIEGILPANALGVLYGAPGVGKTFLALSMALSIAAGHPWCGKLTKSGSVLYVAAEGVFGLRLRVQAYQGRHGIAAKDIRYLGHAFDLRLATNVEKLISTLEAANFRPDFIVLDTLARLIPGADENSAQDIGKAICAIDELKHKFSATVLVVHHTGKDGGPERGSSALRGAADAMIKCRMKPSDPHSVWLECDKMKDSDPFRPATVELERVQIGASVSSLAVASFRDEAKARASREETALKVLAQRGSAGATYKEWLDAYTTSATRSKSTFDRALDQLKNDAAVRWNGERYYARHANGGVKCQEVSKEVMNFPRWCHVIPSLRG